MVEVPHGERECVNCTFYHPERPTKICSVFRELQNRGKDCSAYIDNGRRDDGDGE